MNVLAMDTCFAAVSVAVRWRSASGDVRVYERYEPLTTGHAERLLPMIAEVMVHAALGYGEINRIAVTSGPGGFTGLRAGIAAARALALAIGCPVVGLSSLDVMARHANVLLGSLRAARPIAVVVDAKRAAFFVQVFGAGDCWGCTPPQLVDAETAIASWPSGPLLVVGSGAAALAAIANRRDVEVMLPDLQPHARQLVLAAPILQPMDQVSPLYLRPADAKPSSASALPRKAGPR